MDIHINIRSFINGCYSVSKPLHFFKPEYWNFSFLKVKSPWLHMWTPKWHKGRGPYITIGIICFRVIRGY